MIEGVVVKPLKAIVDERGRIMEMVRRDDVDFPGFGQTYLCTVNPGAIKAWHRHKLQYDHFVCLKGEAKVVLFCPVTNEYNEFFLSEHAPRSLRIPPGVWHGMKGISVEPALIVNTCSEPYNHADPDEERCPVDGLTYSGSTIFFGGVYDWSRKDG